MIHPLGAYSEPANLTSPTYKRIELIITRACDAAPRGVPTDLLLQTRASYERRKLTVHHGLTSLAYIRSGKPNHFQAQSVHVYNGVHLPNAAKAVRTFEREIPFNCGPPGSNPFLHECSRQ